MKTYKCKECELTSGKETYFKVEDKFVTYYDNNPQAQICKECDEALQAIQDESYDYE